MLGGAAQRLALAARRGLLASGRSAQAQDAQADRRRRLVDTAPLLEPGRYSETVAAGETVYWKVKLQGPGHARRATVDRRRSRTTSSKDYRTGWTTSTSWWTVERRCASRWAEVNGGEDASVEPRATTKTGSRTGKVVAPRALGYEQILGDDYTVDKFPAPASGTSRSARPTRTTSRRTPGRAAVELEVSVEGTAQVLARLRRQLARPTPSRRAAAPQDALIRRPTPATRRSRSASRRPRLLGGLGLGPLATRCSCARERLDHQRHGGRRRHLAVGQVSAGKPRLRGGPALYAEEINAAVRGAFAAARARSW